MYVYSKLKVKISLAELQRFDGSFTNCDSERVNILNNYFGRVFTVEDNGEVPSLGDKSLGDCLTTMVASSYRGCLASIDYFKSRQVWWS